jgi:NADPH-dependent ferric siderophore reductase
MASILEQVTDRAARLLLRVGAVRAVTDLGPGFRRLDIDTDLPAATWAPGAKVQFRMRGTAFRTFTPFDWHDGSVSFLVHRHHGGGPATAWAEQLAVGDEVQQFGPRRSLVLTDLPAAPVLVGDETSVALATTVAAAAQLFEATAIDAMTAALHPLGIEPTRVIERQPDDAHHPEVISAVLDALAANPGAPLVVTGKSTTIRAVRAAVKDAGLSPVARVKTYWDPNRSGLD